jgi:hypothetical protein|tara:strand:- start:363 stop:671 length:309 start_codon:yes stop_codon:yes gene_type:complete
MVKVIPIEKKDGMINQVSNWLYRLEDIQNAMGAIGLSKHNEKLVDELTGFPNKKDKTIGEFVPKKERAFVINVKSTDKNGKSLSNDNYRLTKDGLTNLNKEE